MQFLTPKQVCAKIALSRATLDRMVADGRFPTPIRLTERRLAYEAHLVEAWMAQQVERENA
ncbi:transcriptional regulator, AlpA family [Altererythrobacter xiamenensis]|uniref:Transcriptional regulator, AlpA family n=1 Tax=Altererythrobacter xiamenensis TaxID=1316679 RepID=A0A1Y6FIQ8_9SPHN|nr:AlpA family phage regulatory protein [Altererythrobacter xiamenensis]SMQ74276.1 transcriptional regulator, AlpA family [Altererythrobacter xiamenensis]